MTDTISGDDTQHEPEHLNIQGLMQGLGALSRAASSASLVSLHPPPPHLTPLNSRRNSIVRPNGLHSRYNSSSHWSRNEEHFHSSEIKGILTVEVVEARNLEVHARDAQPYVLVQYDGGDSISAAYGEKRPKSKTRLHERPFNLGMTPLERPLGSDSSDSEEGVRRTQSEDHLPLRHTDEWHLVRGSPESPQWNHTATFDVVDLDRPILVCVYDRNGDMEHSYLGAALLATESTDVWLPLDQHPPSRLHVRTLYHAVQTRVSVEDFQIVKSIGQGSYAKVYLVKKRDTKQLYAMKVIVKDLVKSDEGVKQIQVERKILAVAGQSPFLVGLKFSFQTETALFFVIDYKSGGELFMMQRGQDWDEAQVRFYISEILLGLDFLHQNNIIYRDLKPENCLLDASGHVALVDFGLSKVLPPGVSHTSTMCGTTLFIAPEVLLEEPYTYTCDYWSMGVLLYELSFKKNPFESESVVNEYEKILEEPIVIPSSQRGFTERTTSLIERLLVRDPLLRLAAPEIHDHPYFESISWEKCANKQLKPPYKPSNNINFYAEEGADPEWSTSTYRKSESVVRSKKSNMFSISSDTDLEDPNFRDFSYSFEATQHH